ncbi:MFS transporter [Streptosporangium sp. NPDC006930]|uniref:MFS transporter n=1 Tax=Streptosporangium sp. NPDC006930 TaxID=3154783 RepID=UPI003419FCA2
MVSRAVAAPRSDGSSLRHRRGLSPPYRSTVWSRSFVMPFVVHLLGLAVFAQATSEFMLSGLVPGIARDLHVSIPAAGFLTSAFAVGMVIGAPLMAILSLRRSRRRRSSPSSSPSCSSMSWARSPPTTGCCWSPGSSGRWRAPGSWRWPWRPR